jgi:hypothetical protein
VWWLGKNLSKEMLPPLSEQKRDENGGSRFFKIFDIYLPNHMASYHQGNNSKYEVHIVMRP